MIEPIVLDIIGAPITQGSKTAMARGGRAWVIEGSTKKAKVHAEWREAVAAAAREWQENEGDGLIEGPVIVLLHFRMPKPASAPKRTRTWPIKARSGDVDKLARSILDSLTNTILKDDSQVLALWSDKDWGDPPGVKVTILPRSCEEADRPAAIVTWRHAPEPETQLVVAP